MSIAKKGSRKIIVNTIAYRWRVPKYKRISDWKIEREVLSEKYMEVAQAYGLGSVADIVFNIPIELYENPKSKIILKYFGLCVDGFMGPEQLAQIKPKLINEIIREALIKGWNPNKKGDIKIELYENTGKRHRPAILVLPDHMNNEVIGYDNLIKAIQIL